MKFIVSNITASRVNLHMNDFAAGLPSPLAFLGLGAAMAPDLGCERWKVGVLPILHDVQVSQGRTKPEMIAEAGRFRPSEIVEDLIGTVRFSLVIDAPDCFDELKVQSALVGRNIAGGTFANLAFEVKKVVNDGALFSESRRGWAMLPPEDHRLRVISTGELSTMSKIAELLFQRRAEPLKEMIEDNESEGDDKPEVDQSISGWIVPLAVGHYLMEDPATVPKRSGVRDSSIPHVITEPVVGLGELVSVRNARMLKADEATVSNLFWRWHAKGDWILGHPSYHPENLGL